MEVRINQIPFALVNRPRQSTSARKQGQQAITFLQAFKRQINRKRRNGHRLSAVESHLLANIPHIRNNLFAPSASSVAFSVFRAFIRPITLASVYIWAILAIANTSSSWFSFSGVVSAEENKIEKFLEVQTFGARSTAPIPDRQDLTELAFALSSDLKPIENFKGVQENHQVFQQIDWPILPLAAPEVKQVQYIEQKVETAEERVSLLAPFRRIEADPQTEQLQNSKNLVKFISGLIAAFRPSVQDPGDIARHIVEISVREKIDPLYVASVISIESRFHPRAQSGAGALGLMQLMPTTAKELSLRRKSNSHSYQHLIDARTNIKLGIDYLKYLENKYRGNRYLALAAYNWGPANVDLVNSGSKRIPGSVKTYSNQVIKTALRWRNHFAKAKASADAIERIATTG